MTSWLAKHRFKLLALVTPFVILGVTHVTIRKLAHIAAPNVTAPAHVLVQASGDTRYFGTSSVRRRGEILQVNLTGTPEQLGFAHARLLRSQMIENEQVLLGHFERTLPNSWARAALLDLALWRYRDVHRGMSSTRLSEIAATARGFEPDPFKGFFDTFQRFVYLNALYDMALSFEHSPLIGCTSFVLNARGSAGAPVLARSFDFEVDPIFDRDKAVFLVRESGKIPFASVAWPGLTGVVTGMNQYGLALVVHGARAGAPRRTGEPVVHSLRRVLSSARTTPQALQQLKERDVMVSHIVVLLDEYGDAAVVERAPGHPGHVRRLSAKASVTNHFEGPLAQHPRNVRVKSETSTLQRRARADQLLSQLSGPATPARAVELLRDRAGIDGRALPLGDRNAIDALIATHAVVMDAERRQLWVSEGPHVLGRFVLFDLPSLLEAPARGSEAPTVIGSDPALHSPEVQRHLARQTEN